VARTRHTAPDGGAPLACVVLLVPGSDDACCAAGDACFRVSASLVALGCGAGQSQYLCAGSATAPPSAGRCVPQPGTVTTTLRGYCCESGDAGSPGAGDAGASGSGP